jgi:two-component system CheB/CheR fusion protein
MDEVKPPRIVGIGASAGGLEALEEFFAAVPAASGLAYIVVQHLDPTHKAMLRELLQRVTSLPVREATQAKALEPDSVYVIPANRELTVHRGNIRLSPPAQSRGARLPIDALFYSLAQEQGEHAIGVVLSGMGSDGTLGLIAIKRQGGLTMAQSPATAQFDSMPASAIVAGCVDIIAPADELPRRIAQIAAGAAVPEVPAAGAPLADDPAGSLRTILELLRDRTRHDLSSYKTSTLLRRVERRMAVHGLDSMAQYESLLRENPGELDLMFREMLIGVTAFFREPAAWQQLQDEVLPALIARQEGAPLRAWVVGCSTGEEAYTLAMAFQEARDAQPQGRGPPCTLQIFATDLSADAIEIARKGRFPKSVANDLGPERLARFFSETPAHFVVKKALREMVLFAKHDVILDPPFTRLDILSCRNLLIYFTVPLQRRLMPLFHYCLRPGGTLLLAGAESAGSAQSLFTPISPRSRLYRRNDLAIDHGAVHFPVGLLAPHHPRKESFVTKPPDPRVDPQTPDPPRVDLQPLNLQALAEQIILDQFAPPIVLVNDRGDILYIHGRTGRYLEPAAGKANWNIHAMARPGIRAQLAAGLRQATQKPGPVELRDLKIEGDAEPLDVLIRPIRNGTALDGTVMIVFRDLKPAAGKRKRSGSQDLKNPDLDWREELRRSREEVRALRQETQASQEALQAANEELQSTNEELQSANEELTSSKEETQSMNEELQTLNSELRSKLDDLAMAQSDMDNLLNSTDIATLFLDDDLNVRRFTEQATQMINLREGDIGRPLSDLTMTLDYPTLGNDARQTLRTLVVSEREVATSDDKWFAVRIMPYRTVANVIQGVVITFVNITAAKKLESRLRNG